MKQVKARKDAISASRATASSDGCAACRTCTVYAGHARFESPRAVRVGDERADRRAHLHQRRRPRARAADPGLDRRPLLTNTSMMDVDFLPAHLVIVGGSYIGLEFAQMYRRFGSAVTIVEMAPRLIAREDEDVSDGHARDPRARGHRRAHWARSASPSRRRRRASRVGRRLRGRRARGRRARTCCSPSGRRPNTDDLGLDKAGVAIDARGYIIVDDQLRTNVPGHLGARRLQRPRRLHPHVLQRLRDRRREPARRRAAPRQRPDRRLRACSSTRRSAASA